MKYSILYDSNFSQVRVASRHLMEFLRRDLGHEGVRLNITEKSFNPNNESEYIIVMGGIWKGEVSSQIRSLLEHNWDVIKDRKVLLCIASHLDKDLFTKKLVNSLPEEILKNSHIFRVGMDVEYSKLNPSDKIWWTVTRQKVRCDYNRSQVSNIASFIVSGNQE